jgi:hypothetical protein
MYSNLVPETALAHRKSAVHFAKKESKEVCNEISDELCQSGAGSAAGNAAIE